ncbi:MAG: DNA gyrase inhibitor YacG [Pseudomonadota bacterium]
MPTRKSSTSSRSEVPGAGKPACPVCGALRADDFKPFCSKRCADVDLHRWLSGGYAIPAVEAPDPDDLPDGEES